MWLLDYHDISTRIGWDFRSLVTTNQMLRQLPHISSNLSNNENFKASRQTQAKLHLFLFLLLETRFLSLSAVIVPVRPDLWGHHRNDKSYYIIIFQNSPKRRRVNPFAVSTKPRRRVGERLLRADAGWRHFGSRRFLGKILGIFGDFGQNSRVKIMGRRFF